MNKSTIAVTNLSSELKLVTVMPAGLRASNAVNLSSDYACANTDTITSIDIASWTQVGM